MTPTTDLSTLRDVAYGVALRFGLDADEADDAAQETLVRIWEQACQDQTPVGPGLAVIVCRRICIDLSRSAAHRRRLASGAAERVDLEVLDAASEAAQQDQQTHVRRAVRDAVAGLPESLSAVLAADLDGVPRTEMARRLGLSATALRARASRARIRLRQPLADALGALA